MKPSIQTASTALITAGITLLIARTPAPDTTRLEAAAGALAADAANGVRALAFEIGRLWARHGQTLEIQQGLGLAAAIALAGLAGLGLAFWRRRNGAPAPRHRGHRRATPRPHNRRVDQARSLATRGGLPVEVARQTTLSRDAVELLARIQPPEGFSGRGRNFRRGGSGRLAARA